MMKLSHTFVSMWERCPKQAHHKYVLRDAPRESSPAMDWGNRVHEALDGALKDGRPLPEDVGRFSPYLASLKRLPNVQSEVKLGMTFEGKACAFSADDVWLRGAVDVLILRNNQAVIVDWKTGKRREEAGELEIHALLVKTHYPETATAHGMYMWLKDQKVGTLHNLSDFARTYGRLKGVTNTIEAANRAEAEWPANPTPLCGWCHVKSCKFWRDRT